MDNELKGVLFKNEKKTSDNHPDYKGTATIGGVEYWLSSWINTSAKDGKKYMALSFQAKDHQQSNPVNDAGAKVSDDDIPF